MTTTKEFDSLLPANCSDRRSFITTVAAAGFALAVQPVQAQTVISTVSDNLEAGNAGIPVEGGALPIYYARPAQAAGKLPTILVVQEIFGVHEYIRDVCRRLAKLGYLAIAPELYFRQGDPAKLDNVGAILESIVSKVPDAQVLADLDATAAWALGKGGDDGRLAITGFCWGGRITWLYSAHNPKVKAGVAWYGKLDGAPSALTPRHPLDIAGSLRTPVLGLYGGQDQGIPLHDVEAMQAELKKAGGKSEIIVYPDAPHAFHADYRPSYRKEAAEDGWKRLQAWFRAHGV